MDKGNRGGAWRVTVSEAAQAMGLEAEVLRSQVARGQVRGVFEWGDWWVELPRAVVVNDAGTDWLRLWARRDVRGVIVASDDDPMDISLDGVDRRAIRRALGRLRVAMATTPGGDVLDWSLGNACHCLDVGLWADVRAALEVHLDEPQQCDA
jgi:hypothetical protein